MAIYGYLALNISLFGLNAMAFWWSSKRMRWLNFAGAVSTGVIAALLAVLAISNLFDGCGPLAPAEVEFKQGMTICPGQTARGNFHIDVGQDRHI